jgi:hypothetical protein
MRLKFIQDYQAQAKDGESYEEGQVVEFDDSNEAGRRSAQHYLNRGVAVEEGSTEDKAHESRKESGTSKGAAGAKATGKATEGKPSDSKTGDSPTADHKATDSHGPDAAKSFDAGGPQAMVPPPPKKG